MMEKGHEIWKCVTIVEWISNLISVFRWYLFSWKKYHRNSSSHRIKKCEEEAKKNIFHSPKKIVETFFIYQNEHEILLSPDFLKEVIILDATNVCYTLLKFSLNFQLVFSHHTITNEIIKPKVALMMNWKNKSKRTPTSWINFQFSFFLRVSELVPLDDIWINFKFWKFMY